MGRSAGLPDEEKEENKENENEAEIKRCEIAVDETTIPFSYYHQFKQARKHIIKYKFQNPLTNLKLMFSECELMKKIDLSNLNVQNITDMSCMFTECKKLEDINFSSLNFQKVTNIQAMFSVVNL